MKKPSGRFPQREVAEKRIQRRVIWVLTEGEQTEPAYLDMWAHHNTDVHLEIRDTGMSPDALVRRAKAHKRGQPRKQIDRDFDEIWCVSDTDEHKKLRDAIQDARQSGVEMVVSNPCFELWLVLHVQNQTGYIHRHDVQRLSEKVGLTNGKKIAETAHHTLIDAFDIAKERAQTLDELHAGNDSPDRSNPSTDVWRLVDQLRDGE